MARPPRRTALPSPIISRLALDQELRNGSVVILDVPRWRLARAIALVTARDVPLSPPARLFQAFSA